MGECQELPNGTAYHHLTLFSDSVGQLLNLTLFAASVRQLLHALSRSPVGNAPRVRSAVAAARSVTAKGLLLAALERLPDRFEKLESVIAYVVATSSEKEEWDALVHALKRVELGTRLELLNMVGRYETRGCGIRGWFQDVPTGTSLVAISPSWR
jgi:hypothetical protein